jgi:PHD-finger
MICCERCNVWQHGPCVGVMSENEAPEVYYCEECRPDLHELGNRNQGYMGVLGGVLMGSKYRQSRWVGSSILQMQQSGRRKRGALSKGGSVSPGPTKISSLKKRSTMNSRDAGYDYGILFPGGETDEKPPGDEDREVVVSPETTSSRATSRRRQKRDEDDENETSSSRGKRRRSTSPTKKPDDQMDTSSPHSNIDSSTSQPRSFPPAKRAKRLKLKPDRPQTEADDIGPGTPTLRKPDDLPPAKPARARVPQARSGLTEMRKRVGAILEYVGRLQADVVPTGENTPSIGPRYRVADGSVGGGGPVGGETGLGDRE